MDDAVALVQDRHEVLRALVDASRSKPELVEATPYARSTVDRAIRELVEAELVERDGAGFRATAVAVRMLDAFEEFRETAGLYYDAREAISEVPAEESLPPAVLDGAEIRTPSAEMPTEALVREFEAIESVDAMRTTCPVMLDLYDRYMYRLIVDLEADVEVVFTPSLLEAVASEYSERMDAVLDTGRITAYVLEEIPSYTLAITEGLASARDGTDVTLTVHGERGPTLIVNDSPAAVEWGERRWADLLDDAEQVYPAATDGCSD